MSDLFSPIRVFTGGFAVLGVLSLVASFIHNKIGFLVLRALAGVGGAATIPSAINLIVALFTETTSQAAALNVFALTGAVANMIGLFISGATLLADWRWFFRLIGFIAIPLSVVAFVLLPQSPKPATTLLEEDPASENTPRWRQLDIVGALAMTVALVLFILVRFYSLSHLEGLSLTRSLRITGHDERLNRRLVERRVPCSSPHLAPPPRPRFLHL